MHRLCVRFATLMASLLFFGGQAFALAPCEQIVVDTAGVLRNVPAIEDSARELERLGAVVRVRVAQNHSPEPNLDQHIDAVRVATCPSWTGGDGEIRRNMIVLFVTMNRQLGLYFGDQWDRELERSWPSIASQTMKPLLQSGRLDDALVAALKRITTIVQGDTVTAPSIVERTIVRTEPREPFDWSPVAWVLGLIVLLLALIFGGRRFYGFWEHHQKVEGARRGKQQEAINAFGETAALIESVHRLINGLSTRLAGDQKETLVEWAGTTQSSKWSAVLASVESRLVSPEARFNKLTDPRGEGGAIEEYEAVLHATNGILEELRRLNDELITLDAEIQTAAANARDFPALKARVTKVVAEAGDRIKAVKGFKVESFIGQLQAAEKRDMPAADALFAEKRYAEAIETLKSLEVAATTLAQEAESLPERKRTILDGLRTVEEELRSLTALRGSANTSFANMNARFAPQCIDSVVGNGSRAEALLTEVPTICRDIIRFADAEDWVSAEAELEKATKLVAEAEGLLSAIEELNTRLEAELVAAIDEVAEAERSILVARHYLTEHPEDTSASEHAPKLKEAERLAQQAKRMLAEDRPDVVEALKVAVAADAQADGVYDKAVSEYEAAERKRARAAKLAEEAESALAEAERYQRNHHGAISSATKRRIREAREQWDGRSRSGDVDQLIVIATSVNNNAGSSLSAAKSEVRSSERSDTGGGSINWGTSSSRDTGGGSIDWNPSPAPDPSPGTGGGSTGW